MHRDGVAGENSLDIAILDEPLEVRAGAGVYQRGADYPHEVPSPSLLLAHPGRELLVIHRSLSAHFGGHETEFVDPVPSAQKAASIHHDALSAILRLAHSDQLTPPEPPGFDRLQRAGALYYHAIHARTRRR
jgi:hypothetical protein